MINLTTHTIVKNEENWVWFSLSSVKDFVSKMLVFDDGSTDQTDAIIKMINSSKIKLESGDLKSPKDHTRLRNKMLARTTTDWFLLLDGDEIWNRKTLTEVLLFLEKLDQSVYGVVMRTRNCVGDVFHYSPENAGRYHLLGRTGHLTVRAYRKLPGFRWEGEYPLEVYVDDHGRSINDQASHLAFFDGYYWHTTHLRRSSDGKPVKGQRQERLETGVSITGKDELPEVFFAPRPKIVPDPLYKRSPVYEVASAVLQPIKHLKRSLLHG